MTKNEFKQRWESNPDGGGITFEDISTCAIQWLLYSHPKTCDIEQVRYQVLKASGVSDAEDYNPKAS